jgi:peroxiredoxin Q/BCP
MPSTGSAAPGFKLKDQAGRTHSLKEYAGRRVVLWFFPKADTPG